MLQPTIQRREQAARQLARPYGKRGSSRVTSMGSLSTSLINAANALQVYSKRIGHRRRTTSPTRILRDMPVSRPTWSRSHSISTTGAPGGVMLGANPKLAQPIRRAVRAHRADRLLLRSATSLRSQHRARLLQSLRHFGHRSGHQRPLQSFSQLSVTPNDTVARQTVLNDATTVAQDFNDAANGLLSQANNLQQATSATITSINQLAGTIAQINSQTPRGSERRSRRRRGRSTEFIARSVVAIRQLHRAATAGRTSYRSI